MKLSEQIEELAREIANSDQSDRLINLWANAKGMATRARSLESKVENIPTINKMNLDDGDTLVFRYKDILSMDAKERVYNIIKRQCSDNKIMIVDGGASIDILAKEKIIDKEVKNED